VIFYSRIPHDSADRAWREAARIGLLPSMNTTALAMKRGKSVDFTGYWQRHIAD
jgi:hypothetical protein